MSLPQPIAIGPPPRLRRQGRERSASDVALPVPTHARRGQAMRVAGEYCFFVLLVNAAAFTCGGLSLGPVLSVTYTVILTWCYLRLFAR